MNSFKWSVILVFIIQIIATASFFVPLYFLSATNYFFNISIFLTYSNYMLVIIFYLAVYALSFYILYKIKKKELFVTYLLFSSIHYFVLSQVIYMFLTNSNNDGQTFFVVYPCCIFAAFLNIPMGYLWNKSDSSINIKAN